MSDKRSFGLDIIRASAIIMVVFSHSVVVLANLIPLAYIGSLVGKLIALTFPLGIFGVELFFALSGFLIGGLLFRVYKSDEGFTFKNLKNFWLRRWFRTLPAYYLILLVNFIVWNHFDYHYLFFIQNFSAPISEFFTESWSLTIEEWSYFLFPVLLLAAHYLMASKRKKQFFFLVIFYIIASWIVKFILISSIDTHTGNYWQLFIRPLVICRLDAILYGILLNYLWEEYRFNLEKYSKMLFQIGMWGLLVSYALMILAGKPFCFSSKYVWHKIYADFMSLPLINIFTLFLIPRLLTISLLWGSRLKRGITYISKISYSMYLLHFSFLILFFFRQKTVQVTSPVNAVVIFLFYWIATITCSHILYVLVERPFLVLRDKVVKE